MKDDGQSSAWERYVEAKRHAFEEQQADGGAGEPKTLEELEAAIAEAAASSGIPETGMPPRSSIHPTARRNLSRWFYQTLVILFVGLVAYLLWWGYQNT
ncbi:hypothetical protein COLU111180_07935 [Cohnella lubricantis]|uniref:Uncharacterized protein n=1 Tax=Cohnella lubricantis TaxID=2163172 RepID=A0A841TCH8_9BACL|nr:hypothetical protein [Cohnella lubricantis]MBB6677715.1 hypothetical protein [Cohnella lubricantis]MBP2117677.1 hypothetical protein [Cohnella lubricantis]